MPEQRAHQLLLCGLASFIAVFMTVAASNYSYAQFGDVEIYYNCSESDLIFKCDQIMCPNETERCHVEKYKSNADPGILVRENTCYSRDNEVLAQCITNETIDQSTNVRLKVDIYRSGSSSVQESYSTHNANSNSYNSVNSVNGGNGQSIGHDIVDAIDQANVSKELNFEFVDFAKISKDVEDNIRKTNQQIEDQLQDIREQMSNNFQNLFWRG